MTSSRPLPPTSCLLCPTSPGLARSLPGKNLAKVVVATSPRFSFCRRPVSADSVSAICTSSRRLAAMKKARRRSASDRRLRPREAGMRTPCASATRSHTSSRPAAMRHDRLTHPVTRAISRHGSRARISTKTSSGNAARGVGGIPRISAARSAAAFVGELFKVYSAVGLVTAFQHSIWRAAARREATQPRSPPARVLRFACSTSKDQSFHGLRARRHVFWWAPRGYAGSSPAGPAATRKRKQAGDPELAHAAAESAASDDPR